MPIPIKPREHIERWEHATNDQRQQVTALRQKKLEECFTTQSRALAKAAKARAQRAAFPTSVPVLYELITAHTELRTASTELCRVATRLIGDLEVLEEFKKRQTP
jgi:hypothetical protein